MDDATLNEKLSSLADDGDEKLIPYVGWYWRSVDFTRTLSLYDPTEHSGFDVPKWFGFMENNKWDYEEVQVSDADRDAIRAALVVYVETPSRTTAGAAFDLIQAAGKRARDAAKGEA